MESRYQLISELVLIEVLEFNFYVYRFPLSPRQNYGQKKEKH